MTSVTARRLQNLQVDASTWPIVVLEGDKPLRRIGQGSSRIAYELPRSKCVLKLSRCGLDFTFSQAFQEWMFWHLFLSKLDYADTFATTYQLVIYPQVDRFLPVATVQERVLDGAAHTVGVRGPWMSDPGVNRYCAERWSLDTNGEHQCKYDAGRDRWRVVDYGLCMEMCLPGPVCAEYLRLQRTPASACKKLVRNSVNPLVIGGVDEFNTLISEVSS